MTRYRLPEALGGGEYEAIAVGTGEGAGGPFRRFEVPGIGRIQVPASACTEVIPPQPPNGFKSYDENIETQFQCPKCGYEWSGRQKSAATE